MRRKNNRCADEVNGIDRDDLLNEFQVADFLGLSVSWLRQSRIKQPKWAGPKYMKLDGYHVHYRQSDLEHFLATRNGGPRIVDPADRLAAAT